MPSRSHAQPADRGRGAQPNSEEAALLEAEHTARVFVGENELAAAMVAHVLRTVEPPAP